MTTTTETPPAKAATTMEPKTKKTASSPATTKKIPRLLTREIVQAVEPVEGGVGETEFEGIDCCRTTGLTITSGILTVVKKLSLWIIVNGLLTFVFRIIVLFEETVVLCINIYEIEHFIIIIITIPDQWITEEPQVTINSNHLNRKLQLQCCGDGSNKSNTSEM